MFEIVEVPENNRNDSENKFKNKVGFSLHYEDCNENNEKTKETENYKSRF